MKKLTLLFSIFPLWCFAQYHQWDISLSGIAGRSIVQTKDGGYAIGGTGTTVCLTKLDSSGNIQWTSQVGSGNYNEANSMVQTKDGGYVLAGTTQRYGAGGMDVYVVKLDSTGALQWTRTIGGPDDDWGNAIVQTKDGGYAITGGTKSFGYGVPGLADIWVIKLDSAGNKKWTKTVEGPWGTDNEGLSIIQAKDRGYAVAGGTLNTRGGEAFFVFKMDSVGNLKWTDVLGADTAVGTGYSIIQAKDGGYAITGQTLAYGAGGFDVYVVKLDSLGKLQWTRTVGGSGIDVGQSIIQSKDKEYIIAGGTTSFSATEGVYVIKFDSVGNLRWNNVYQPTSSVGAIAFTSTKDNGSAIICEGGSGYILLKLDPSGNYCMSHDSGGIVDSGGFIISGGIITSSDSGEMGAGGGLIRGGVSESTICESTGIENIKDDNSLIEAYPNPCNGLFQLEIKGEELEVKNKAEIYNVLGEEILTETFTQDNNTINLSSQPNGIYLYRVLNNNNMIVGKGKLIIQK